MPLTFPDRATCDPTTADAQPTIEHETFPHGDLKANLALRILELDEKVRSLEADKHLRSAPSRLADLEKFLDDFTSMSVAMYMMTDEELRMNLEPLAERAAVLDGLVAHPTSNEED